MIGKLFSRFRSLRPGPLNSFWYSLFPMLESGSNKVVVNEHTAYTYSVVWAATRLLSATGSSLPLNLYERVGERRVIAQSHPVHRLFRDGFSAETSAMLGRSLGIQRQVNSGNFFAYINRTNPRQVRLEPIHHSRLRPIRVDDKLAGELGVETNSLAWEYNEPQAKPKTIPDVDMFHITSMMTDDGIIGKGVITQARESIGLGLATEMQGRAYMENAARPSLVIKGRFKDQEQREDFRRQWAETHGGSQNNAKPALLPPEFDIDKLTFSPEDSQFLQTRQHNVEEVARWYGVPPHLIGHLLRSTFNNIETQSIEFVVYSLVPWLKLWEEEISRKLLTEDERDRFYPKHNIEGLLRGDTSARAAFYQSLWNLGVISVNEIRAKEDLNPIGSEGDKRFVPLNYTTLDKAGEPDEMITGQDGTVLRWGNNQIEGLLQAQLDNQKDALQRLLEFTETNAPADQLQSALDNALVQKRAVDKSLEKREDMVRRTALEMVNEAWSRVISKQLTALSRATKDQSQFFDSLDAIYERLETTAKESLEVPVGTWLVAGQYDENAPAFIDRCVQQTLKQHREAVLRLTEVEADQWETVKDKLAASRDTLLSISLETMITNANQPEVV